DVGVTEGNSGTTPAVFTVSVTGATQLPVTVQYSTADGTGVAGTDYQAAHGTVSFNPGESSKTITVLVNGNTVRQAARRFLVHLGSRPQPTMCRTQGAGTINDDCAAPAFSINDVGVTEGNSGTTPAVFTVSVTGATQLPVSVHYATADGTGVAG